MHSRAQGAHLASGRRRATTWSAACSVGDLVHVPDEGVARGRLPVDGCELEHEEQLLDGQSVLRHRCLRHCHICGRHAAQLAHHAARLLRVQAAHGQHGVECVEQLQALEHGGGGGGRHDEELATRGRAADADEQRLQHQVGEARTDARVLDEPLQVVEHHAREGRLERVVEGARDRGTFGALAHTHIPVGRDELHERPGRAEREMRRECSLTRTGRTLE
mmetsp:Transcript_20809/g.52810  ORF Transcript_20809/g.52810 Transcript_20809/m.52810 type:complete len:220 (+) Transcript_20809:170-829(+)